MRASTNSLEFNLIAWRLSASGNAVFLTVENPNTKERASAWVPRLIICSGRREGVLIVTMPYYLAAEKHFPTTDIPHYRNNYVNFK